MAPPAQASTAKFSCTDFLLLALWWGVLTGLGEGFLAPSYVWHDLMRAGVEVEPWLFLGAGLILIASKRRLQFFRDDLAQYTFLFSGLTLFACISRSPLAPSVPIAMLSAIAAASLFSFIWFLRGPTLVRWQKRSLPILLILALWCIVGFPIKQRRHEAHDLARLPAASPGQPNVLVIVVDTLRADHLSTYGYARPTSPHLTQLAAQGTLFENAIAPSSWTLPVHASLLTGLYPDQHHVDNDGSLLGWHYRTLGEAFMARGYRTAAFSANTLLFCRHRGFGRGFIHFEDDFQSYGSRFAQTFYGDLIKHLLFRLQLKRDLFGRRNARDINRHALRWIDSDRRPFFVFLNYLDVHDPYRPPEPYLHRYTTMKHPGSRASEHWNWFEHMTPQQRQGALDAYDGAINYVDDHIHDLMQQLQRRGLDRNTLVVITSDHGESFGEHGLMTHGNALYRELIHVPLILWAPGRIPAGKRIDTPISLTSLPATLLEEVGDARHPHFPQPSLVSLWSGSAAPALPDPMSELAQLNWSPAFPDYYGPMQSITTAHWHYIHGGKFHDELFPCCTDEPEKLDLAGSVIGRALTSHFQSELALASGHPLPGAKPLLDASLGSTYHLDFEPDQLLLADFDANGSVDIVVSGKGRDQLALLLGDGKGGFQPTPDARRILRQFIKRNQIRVTETDLAQCSQHPAPQPCASALARALAESHPPLLPPQGRFEDVNGDGLQDVLLGQAQGQATGWLQAEGHGRFHRVSSAAPVSNAATAELITLARGDVDGNGRADLAFADKAHNAVVFLLATSDDAFTEATLPVAHHPTAIGLADLNHNGRADLVVISRASKSVTVMLSL